MDENDRLIAPQADDIDKILDLPLAIAEGANTKYLLSKKYDFHGRQADYYLEAGEALGLVQREEGIYLLTDEGKKYRRLDPPRQKILVIRKMLVIPLMALILSYLISSPERSLSRNEIESILKKHVGIHGTTVPRRAQTLLVWFRWLGEETGVFSANPDAIQLRTS
jgi:hypothetical protein